MMYSKCQQPYLPFLAARAHLTSLKLFILEQKNTIKIIRLWDELFLLVLSSTLSAAKVTWPFRNYESTKHCTLSVAECVCVCVCVCVHKKCFKGQPLCLNLKKAYRKPRTTISEQLNCRQSQMFVTHLRWLDITTTRTLCN